jgi:hypothetical protein
VAAQFDLLFPPAYVSVNRGVSDVEIETSVIAP